MAQHWTPADITDQTGRTALITGGNSGLGLETARVLAAHGARVILAGRSQARLDEAVAALRAQQPDADLDTLVVDLGDLASIRDVHLDTLDLLINNAGVMNVPERTTTKDGFELTFGTNHLGHFALTEALLPALLRAPAPRVVTVSAIAATWPSGALSDLMSEQRYRPMAAYAKSKRANIVFTAELARRTTVKAIVVHPGAAMTNLQRHTTSPVGRAVTRVLEKLMMGSPEGAAWPTLYAATSPDVPSGAFIGPAGRDQTSGTPKILPMPRNADDPAEGARLWATSEKLISGVLGGAGSTK